MWLLAPNISGTHGFSTRHGGISPEPYSSLNLGGSEDLPDNIRQNREKALQTLGFSISQLCFLKQVHSNKVQIAREGIQEGDALVSNVKGKVLAVSAADCYPILFEDKKNGVIGAAHAGWRGTVNRIAGQTVKAMLQLGAETRHLQVAIGQGICKERFEVGEEVKAVFRQEGFPEYCIDNKQIDLIAANRFVLSEHEIEPDQIWSMNRCTYEPDFFSYRRDKGVTGRMWGVIGIKS